MLTPARKKKEEGKRESDLKSCSPEADPEGRFLCK